MIPLRSRAAATALLAIALGVTGCSPPAGDGTLPGGTPVVLISIDTLRSDRLPVYGYSGVETPAIDRFRDDAILFDKAYSPIPLTFPAHATMLTGLLPPEHGVRDNMGYRLDTASVPYLPLILGEMGYATGAAVSSFVLRGNAGLADGFELFEDRIEVTGDKEELGSVQRRGDATLDLSLAWLRGVADRPFFFLFHIYEPHAPYDPPPPYRKRYRSLYDGEIAAADVIVGRLLDELRALGAYDRALVILTSDHGEALGEHGYQEHGPFVYRESLQVPLLLKLPGGRSAGTSIDAPAHLMDIVPTVLTLLGREVPGAVRGTSLLALDGSPNRSLYGESFYARLHFGWSELLSIIEYPYHYIHGPGPELFDLESDPEETRNLADSERRVVSRLRRELESYDTTLAPPGDEDPETRDRLAALGYLGGAAADAGGPAPNPRDRVHVLEAMREGVLAFFDERNKQALAVFRQVVAEEPRMVDGWWNLGRTLMRMGRVEEAYDAFRQGMEISGGAPHIALPAANALLRMGRLEEARQHAQIAAATLDAAHDVLAQVALRRGELDEAEEHLERALATRGARIAPLITMAELRFRQERYREAVELTEQAERELGPDADPEILRGTFFTRGRAWARLGEAAKAEAAFRRETELSPDALAPYAHLAYLYALEGRGGEAGATLRRMVEANPRPEAYATAVRTLREMGDASSAAAVLRQALGRWPGDPELRELASG